MKIINIVSCINSNDFHLIRTSYFLNKIDEVSQYNSAKEYFQNIFDNFLNNYSSLEDLSKESNYKKQLYAYYIALINKKIGILKRVKILEFTYCLKSLNHFLRMELGSNIII
jgi:LPS O-antigen subunit length determinant protein (WzzB/FepE family)